VGFARRLALGRRLTTFLARTRVPAWARARERAARRPAELPRRVLECADRAAQRVLDRRDLGRRPHADRRALARAARCARGEPRRKAHSDERAAAAAAADAP